MKKILVVVCVICLYFLYHFNIIEHKKYTNEDFKIESYYSKYDKDQDGIDDQSDILKGVRAYLKTKPKYQSKYYAGGYSNDEYGVCSDVVANGLLNAGYDLQQLVDEDIKAYPKRYNISKPDKNIDFRRVRNLAVYFKYHALSLTTDVYDLDKWQGGDIVVFKKHIEIVSNYRNHHGVSFLIHHAHKNQLHYEEDVLEKRDDIIGHYRIS